MPTEVVLVSASPRLLQRLPPDLTCPLEEVAAILVIDLFPKTFALALIVSWTDRSRNEETVNSCTFAEDSTYREQM